MISGEGFIPRRPFRSGMVYSTEPTMWAKVPLLILNRAHYVGEGPPFDAAGLRL
jgi:hypothetical protein